MSAAESQPDAGFAAIVDADTLQQFVDTLTTIVSECKLQLQDDGLRVRAVDPANVAMVDTRLDAGAFESYQDASDEVLGINLDRLDDILGLANSGDLVHLDLDAETRTLHIAVGELSYTLALIDPDSIRAEPDIPDLDLPAELVVPGAQIERGATAADLVSDHIRFRADPEAEAFVIEAEGDTDDVEVTVDEELLDASVSEAAESLFSLDYVTDLKQPLESNTEVTVELGDEFPTKWHYEFADGAGEVTSMLAPRISSD